MNNLIIHSSLITEEDEDLIRYWLISSDSETQILPTSGLNEFTLDITLQIDDIHALIEARKHLSASAFNLFYTAHIRGFDFISISSIQGIMSIEEIEEIPSTGDSSDKAERLQESWKALKAELDREMEELQAQIDKLLAAAKKLA